MANPVAATNRAGYDQALNWAQQNLSAGIDSESLVNGLIKQGWPEYDARMVLDNVLSRPTPPPLPVNRPMNVGPKIMNYAGAKPAGQQAYQNSIKDAHRKRMLIGAAWFGFGVVITVVSLGAAISSNGGGTYLVCYGPIIFGGYRMVSGFIGWVNS